MGKNGITSTQVKKILKNFLKYFFKYTLKALFWLYILGIILLIILLIKDCNYLGRCISTFANVRSAICILSVGIFFVCIIGSYFKVFRKWIIGIPIFCFLIAFSSAYVIDYLTQLDQQYTADHVSRWQK